MLLHKANQLVVLALVLLTAACRPAGTETRLDGENPANPSATIATPIPQPLPDPPPADQPAGHDEVKPPPATLTVDGSSQISGIGTYCWSGEGVGICADMIGIPTSRHPLEAHNLALLQFDLPLDEQPHEVHLTVTLVNEDDTLPDSPGDYLWWPYGEGASYSLPNVPEPLIELSLQPGMNVLNLFVAWPGYGDVSYGFLLDVTNAGGDGSDGSPTEPPTDSLPCPAAVGSPEALACAIQAALRSRDLARAAELMADPFMVGYWRSEGRQLSPTAMADELNSSGLPADSSGLTFTTDRSRFPAFEGIPVDGMFGPDVDIALVIYSQGWSADGAGAALIFIAYDEMGRPVWHGLGLASAGFE